MNSFKNKNVWVVIAAYNEGNTIKDVIDDLFSSDFNNIVVVDDGSSDATGEIAKESGANLVRHQVNRGQGAALQTGIEYATFQGADYLVTFDADGQHLSSDINTMLQALINSGADIALGSRFLGSVINVSKKRLVILKIALLWTKLTTGLQLTDVHNGLRVMSKKFSKEFQFTYDRMSHASEILSFIAKNKIKYIEHPVTIKYTQQSIANGQKNINAVSILLDLITRRIF